MKRLSQSQLRAVTGTNDVQVQREILRRMGIMPIPRADGGITVFEDVLREATIVRHSEGKHDQPEWGALDGQETKKSA